MWRRNFLKFLSVLPVCPWNIKLPKVNNFKSEFYAYETIQVPLYPIHHGEITVPEEVLELLSLDILKMIGA